MSEDNYLSQYWRHHCLEAQEQLAIVTAERDSWRHAEQVFREETEEKEKDAAQCLAQTAAQLVAVTAERDRLVRAVNNLENMLDGGVRYGNDDNPVDRLKWRAQNVNTTIALARQNDDLRASLKAVTAERDAMSQRIANAKKVMNQDYGQDIRWYALVPLDEELNSLREET